MLVPSIAIGSEAWEVLASIMADEDTYRVSFDLRADGRLAIKQNARMWTPPLETGA